jgi:D-inositol-3-phosphate glycosyltransferase
VKNASLAEGDRPEPLARLVGEDRIAAEADRLIASTADEAHQLRSRYGARADQVVTVPPGVDLELFRMADASAARTRLGVPPDAVLLLFVGRIQPLKAPDVLLRAVPPLLERMPELRRRLQVAIVGGPSGTGLDRPESLHKLAAALGIADLVRFEPPARANRLADWYRAADVTVVPSHSESFGLVALESQACGTPVVAAAVGGLTTAVRDGESGLLVDSHRPADFAAALERLVTAPGLRARMAGAARRHAERFAWQRTAEGLLVAYRGALADRGSAPLAAAVGGS